MPTACTTLNPANKNPTQFAQHSIFLAPYKKNSIGAIVAAPSFDAELHIETTTIMFADVVESVRFVERVTLLVLSPIELQRSNIKGYPPPCRPALIARPNDYGREIIYCESRD